MHLVTPKVYLVSTSIAQLGSIKDWLIDLGVSDKRAAELIYECSQNPAECVVALAGRRCYNSFEPGLNPNVTKTRTDFGEYIDNILKSGHGNVLEHVTVSMTVEGCSRVFTAELNRHRAGMAISEASMRYIRFEDIGFWMPDSIHPTRASNAVMDEIHGVVRTQQESELDIKKGKTRDIFNEAFQNAEDSYKKLLSIWSEELDEGSKFAQKKALTSMMRRVIPMGVSTGGMWTGNLRAWRHICELRTSPHAEEEIRLIVGMIYDQLSEWCKNVFGDAEKQADGTVKFKNSKV